MSGRTSTRCVKGRACHVHLGGAPRRLLPSLVQRKESKLRQFKRQPGPHSRGQAELTPRTSRPWKRVGRDPHGQWEPGLPKAQASPKAAPCRQGTSCAEVPDVLFPASGASPRGTRRSGAGALGPCSAHGCTLKRHPQHPPRPALRAGLSSHSKTTLPFSLARSLLPSSSPSHQQPQALQTHHLKGARPPLGPRLSEGLPPCVPRDPAGTQAHPSARPQCGPPSPADASSECPHSPKNPHPMLALTLPVGLHPPACFPTPHSPPATRNSLPNTESELRLHTQRPVYPRGAS